MAEYTQIAVSRHGPIQGEDAELWRAVVSEGGKGVVVDFHVSGSAAIAGVERVGEAIERRVRNELAGFPPNPDRLDVLRIGGPFALSSLETGD